jgi:hypothetical protein
MYITDYEQDIDAAESYQQSITIARQAIKDGLWVLPIRALRNKYALGLAAAKHICELIRADWDEDEIIARLQSICIGQAFTRG